MAYSVTPDTNYFYSGRRLMSYGREWVWRGIIGARGIGKTYFMQDLIVNLYHKVKHLPEGETEDMFIWIRLTDRAVGNMISAGFIKEEILDKRKVKIETITKKGYSDIYFNGRLMGRAMSLQNAPVYKGVDFQWWRYRYALLDEFQRERKERRTFDVSYNLSSLLESVCRFTTRLELGLDLPTVIFAGNTVDEATDLLVDFDFMPLEFGRYKLPKKHAIIEYVEDGVKYKKMQKRNPLRILSSDNDFTFGDLKLKVRDKIIHPEKVGSRKYIGHLQITDYLKFEMWSIQKNGGIYITRGLPTAKFENSTYTLHRLLANRGATYSIEVHKLVREHYNNDNIYFDKNLTAKIFNQNLV